LNNRAFLYTASSSNQESPDNADMKNKRIIFGFVLSIFFTYLIIWKPHPTELFSGNSSFFSAFFGESRIEFTKIWEHMLKASPFWLVICFLITPLHVLVRSHRWALLLRPVVKVKLIDCFSLQALGYFASAVFPLRVGELVRAILLGKKARIKNSTALANVVLERLLDGLSLLAVFVIVGIIFQSEKMGMFREGILIMAGLSLAALFVIMYFSLARAPFGGVTGKILSFFPDVLREKIIEILKGFIAGFSMLKSTKHYPLVTLETVLIWVLYTAQEFSAIIAFGFHKSSPLIAGAPLTAALVILVINAVALSVPSAPGGLGTFHAASVFGLGLFGISEDPAVGFALVLHAITTGYFVLAGILFMWREGLKLEQIKNMGNGDI